MMIFVRLMRKVKVYGVGLMIGRGKDEDFWCGRLRISRVRVLGKFCQSLATFGSEWKGNRGGFTYREGKSCHLWPKTCHDWVL